MLSDASWVTIISARWVHVASACLLVGGTFFLAFVMPNPTGEEPSQDQTYLRSRRGFKMVVHTTLLLLLASGIYNAYMNWEAYSRNRKLAHGLFGPHLLFGLTSFAILLVVLSRRVPKQGERVWVRYTAVLLLVTVLMASALKYAREHPRQQAPGTQISVVRHSG